MGLLYFMLISLGIAFLCLTQAAWSDYEEKKEAEERRIAALQNQVKEDLEKIIKYSERFGDMFYKSLMDFANKMEKLCDDDIKSDLKPYDIYNIQRLHNQFSGLGTMFGRIVIDKNLEPRFMVSEPSTIPSRADIQLEAALTVEEVKELAHKCNRIKMEVNIEKFRKDKVNKALN